MGMEIGLRWILILISIAVLGLIVFDGWRRIKRQQNNKNKNMKSRTLFNQPADSMAFSEENAEAAADELEDFDDFLEDELEEEPASSAATASGFEEIEEEVEADVEAEPAVAAKDMPDTYFILNILASPGHAFSGAQLLPALLSLGLRYGDMSVFHRHEHINGTGAILFSLVSATEPGIFNLNTMESQQFKGLTLFLKMPGLVHPINALNLMVQTTKRLAKMLDGVICDEVREPISESALEQRYNFRMRQIVGRI